MASIDLGRRCEFHTHTFYSDGSLLPAELIRRCAFMGDKLVAITDHVDFTNVEQVIKQQKKIIPEISWDIDVLIGVELTHIPRDKIEKLARISKNIGAYIVIVHGETPVEPVEKGTNHEAVKSKYVDILAHPGNITLEDSELAKENDIFLEITTRRGHLKGNKHVAKVAKKTNTKLLVNTDAHEPEDLITQDFAFKTAVKSGLSRDDSLKVVRDNPREFMKRLK